MISNVRFRLVGSVYVCVEPVRIVYGGIGTPPALKRGVEPTCCLSCGLFIHTHAYGRSLTPIIVSASQGGIR